MMSYQLICHTKEAAGLFGQRSNSHSYTVKGLWAAWKDNITPGGSLPIFGRDCQEPYQQVTGRLLQLVSVLLLTLWNPASMSSTGCSVWCHSDAALLSTLTYSIQGCIALWHMLIFYVTPRRYTMFHPCTLTAHTHTMNSFVDGSLHAAQYSVKRPSQTFVRNAFQEYAFCVPLGSIDGPIICLSLVHE